MSSSSILTIQNTPIPGTRRAAILLAHGSRDPMWRQPVEAVARRMVMLEPTLHVRCAYLQYCSPDLPSCTAELVGLGVKAITVAPLFLGLGKHLSEDLPRLLAALQCNFPEISFDIKKSIGEESSLIDLLAQLAVS